MNLLFPIFIVLSVRQKQWVFVILVKLPKATLCLDGFYQFTFASLGSLFPSRTFLLYVRDLRFYSAGFALLRVCFSDSKHPHEEELKEVTHPVLHTIESCTVSATVTWFSLTSCNIIPTVVLWPVIVKFAHGSCVSTLLQTLLLSLGDSTCAWTQLDPQLQCCFMLPCKLH